MNALSLIKQCVTETLGEQPLRKNAIVDKDKPCTHPNGFEFSGKTPGTGYKVCRMCGAQQPSDRKKIEKAGFHQLFRTHESTGGSQLILTPTGHSDAWSRPVYKGSDGKIYVDINLGRGTPSIHSVTDEGEPLMPVHNYQIGGSPKLSMKNFIEECLTEVMAEDPLYVEYFGQRPGEVPFMMGDKKYEYVNAKYPNGKIDIGVYAFAGDMVYGYNAFRQMMGIKESKISRLVKECVLEVLKDNLTEGGYDPQSQAGPNVPMENPYPEWNSKMAKMEEEEEKFEDYAAMLRRIEKDYNFAVRNPDTTYSRYKRTDPRDKIKPEDMPPVDETEGRYAQQAGAGQFDPRTFGVQNKLVAESVIQWQCHRG